MPSSADRLSLLRSRANEFTGISFVQVADVCDQRVLRVYFHTDPQRLDTPFEGSDAAPITLDMIRIYSARRESDDVQLNRDPARLQWADDPIIQRRYLQIEVLEAGTFTDYRLLISDSRIDPGFNDITFSFKVGCDDDLDCAAPPEPCVTSAIEDVDVDYLARDFISLRNALLDFTAQRYPNWQTPIEADVAMVPLEIIAAFADELSYVQDRYNREGDLETATERRSLRRKARLMDYEIHDGRQASTVLELSVRSATKSVPAGAGVWALVEKQSPIAFELGYGLQDKGQSYSVDSRWNNGLITPYCMDDDQACLRPGDTQLLVRNDPPGPDNPGGIVFGVADLALWENRQILLRDVSADATETERLYLMTVSSVELTSDPLFGINLARITFVDNDELTHHVPLDELQISANLVPATAGSTRIQQFRLGPKESTDPEEMLSAVEREGPLYSNNDGTDAGGDVFGDADDIEPAARAPIYLLSLPNSDTEQLAFADRLNDLRASQPEIILTEEGQPGDPWLFQRSLLLCNPSDQVFALEDGSWRNVVNFQSGEERVSHADYANGRGYTIRLPDGEFGRLPTQGAVFNVEYRLNAGSAANLPANAVTALSIPNQETPHTGPLATLLDAIKNPFPISDGIDPESASEIKSLVPGAYKAETFFAVRPEDYGQQAETLDSVQRSQGSFRWTGSWLAANVAIDPAGTSILSDATRAEAQTLLDARRQTGRQVTVVPPRYVNLDLRITVCLDRSAFIGQVQPAILATLFGPSQRDVKPFFHADHFTFGTPLHRSALEAAIAGVPGVESVVAIQLRIHGVTDFEPFTEFSFPTATDEVIRLDNSRQFPERGSLQLSMVGGA